MAVDMFLKLDGIKGESVDAKHPNEIEVVSYSWGVANSGDAAPRRRGKPHAAALNVNAHTSKASPSLFLHCCTGQHIASGILTARKAGEQPLDFLHIKMTDILISGYQTGSNGNDLLPVETVSLEFAKLQIVYTPQSAAGGPLADISAAFNFLTNRRI
jgi:type VI secretion system secreted protein Hcp